MKKIIDQSQHKKYDFCPGSWFTAYPEALKTPPSEPLLLGSMFHEAMDQYYRKGIEDPIIPKDSILEGTSRELVSIAEQLMFAYIKEYPSEPWKVNFVEEALTKDLPSDWKMVAKLDLIASLEEETRLNLGTLITATLAPGLYILEHKTKKMSVNRGDWVKAWDTDIQADYQLLIAKEHFENVRGIIVNLVEYKPPYHPVKTCSKCQVRSEIRYYLPIEEGLYRCPVCLEDIEFKPKPPKEPDPPICSRNLVFRTDEQLSTSLERIIYKTQQMDEDVVDWKKVHRKWRMSSCIDPYVGRRCDYYSYHHERNSLSLTQIEDPYDYIGLKTQNDK